MLLCASIASAQETTSGCNQTLTLSSTNPRFANDSIYRICSGEAYQGLELTVENIVTDDDESFVIYNKLELKEATSFAFNATTIDQNKNITRLKSDMRCLVIQLPKIGSWLLQATSHCYDLHASKLNIKQAVSPKTRVH
jgi:hypothetical protein